MKSLFICALLLSCSASQQKSVSSSEANLCKARAEFKLLEDVTPSLQPVAASARAKLEIAEDEFCKTLTDAGHD